MLPGVPPHLNMNIKKTLNAISKGYVHPQVKATMEHNAKVKASKKRTMENNVDALVDEKYDQIVNHERKGRRGFKLERIKGWPDTNKCYNGCGRIAKHKMFIAELCDQCFEQEQLKERVC